MHVPILVFVLFVNAAHKRGCWGEHFIDENEDGLLRRQLDPLANDVDELTDSQVGGDEILLLIDGSDIALLNLLADDLVENQYSGTSSKLQDKSQVQRLWLQQPLNSVQPRNHRQMTWEEAGCKGCMWD